jgi:hypothetical protein
LLYSTREAPTQPFLESANGRVVHWEARGRDVELRVQGHVPLVLVIGGATRECALRTPQGLLSGTRRGPTVRFSLAQSDTGEAKLVCR